MKLNSTKKIKKFRKFFNLTNNYEIFVVQAFLYVMFFLFSANLRQYESSTVNYSEDYILKNFVDLGGGGQMNKVFSSLFDTILPY